MTRKIETLIIGGGCIGTCSAYFLAKKGKHVTLVEQGRIGEGCSYGNAGVIALHHIIPLAAPGVMMQGLKWMSNPESPFYIKPRFDLKLFGWLWKFALACREAPTHKAMPVMRSLTQASMDLYDELAANDGAAFHFKHKGSIMLFKNPTKYQSACEEFRHVKQYGVESKPLDLAGVRELEPNAGPRIAGGIYCPQDGHLNPSEFLKQLAQRAEQQGATISTSTEVLGFETRDGRISNVQTTRGDFVPEQVVLAAGSWSVGLASQLQLDLPIQPAKGYSITMKTAERDNAMPLLLSESKVIVTPMGGILRFAGTLELAGMDFSITQRRVRAVQRAVGEYLTGMDKFELQEIWRGLRPASADGLPIISRSQRWTNLVIATGHGMQGIALGPLTGKLVAQLICGETPSVDMAALNASRFN